MSALSTIPTVGPKTIAKLNKLNIFTPLDLLYHFPSRYIDFSHHTQISQIITDENFTIKAQIINFQNIYTRHGKNIQKAIVKDSTGTLDLIWFNQPYLANLLKVNQIFSFAGTVSLYQNKKTIISPIFGQHNTGRIIAIYPETLGLTSNWFRKVISNNLDRLISQSKDSLPPALLKKHHLPSLATAFRQIHLPDNQQLLDQARLRLGSEEILSLQVKSYLQKKQWQSKTVAKQFKLTSSHQNKLNKLISQLPFKLTPSQVKVWNEICHDLLSLTPSNRLLQGDVGSGKTIVAILACYLAHLNQVTSLVIAPTEILASQHYATFTKFLNFPIILLTAKSKPDLKKIKPGSVIISTHAAIYQKHLLQDIVGLLIIDEQHKFGVNQRTSYTNQLHPPHCLTMTATPIPRTISLTILGNLDLSIIDTVPNSRLPVKTFLVPEIKYRQCYQWLSDHIQNTGQQAFIVCPFIDPSETLSSVKSAQKLYDSLKTEIFPKLNIGLIHGRLKQTERQDILQQFLDNTIQILITTPIIEVGIDFPNATTIIVQSADRFGLAQLHQLRGRVGRGVGQSYCYLFSETTSDKAIKRLTILTKTNNGQKIAEYDLATRGPGEAFSYIQHGFPSLKIANISNLTQTSLGQKILKDLLTHYPNFDLNQFIANHNPNFSISN